jgi:enoyl-CoA hydratase/carnithine racemase
MSLTSERVADGVELLRLDRPDVRNAMDRALLRALLDELERLAADAELRVLVISTTSTRALSAGADIGEPLSAPEGVERMELFALLYAALEAFPVPIVAVCVGNVVGAGAELAAAADLRVAGDNLKLGWVGARLGVPVGPARLTPLVGLARAKELIFSGRILSAAEAVDLGLAHEAVPAEEAEARALALAAQVAEAPADALRRLKALFRDLDDLPGRVARENTVLLDFQAGGAGLPAGRGDTGR